MSVTLHLAFPFCFKNNLDGHFFVHLIIGPSLGRNRPLDGLVDAIQPIGQQDTMAHQNSIGQNNQPPLSQQTNQEQSVAQQTNNQQPIGKQRPLDQQQQQSIGQQQQTGQQQIGQQGMGQQDRIQQHTGLNQQQINSQPIKNQQPMMEQPSPQQPSQTNSQPSAAVKNPEIGQQPLKPASANDLIQNQQVSNNSGVIHVDIDEAAHKVSLALLQEQKHTTVDLSSRGAVIALGLGLSVTALLLLFVGCRLRTVKTRLRRGRPLTTGEADYLINGMYL